MTTTRRGGWLKNMDASMPGATLKSCDLPAADWPSKVADRSCTIGTLHKSKKPGIEPGFRIAWSKGF
jgi:hypothetical protein